MRFRREFEPGEIFGRYKVLQEAPPKSWRTHAGRRFTDRFLLVECQCGTVKRVAVRDLLSDHTKSCGCLIVDVNAPLAHAANVTHGMASGVKKTPEYRCWCAIKQRCLNPKNKNFQNYGGRGITVSPSWLGLAGFQEFLADVGYRPSDKHSLDRIDNDFGYEPNNVRWATNKEQSANRRMGTHRNPSKIHEEINELMAA